MILSTQELSIFSQERTIVDQVSLAVREGEFMALVGQSGSGKSLLSQAIGQLLPTNLRASGRVLFEGNNLLERKPKEMRALRGRDISYIFQDYQGAFTPFRSIGGHFDEYQKVHGEKSATIRKKRAAEALESVGLSPELLRRYPFQLSGGQLQRASIATSLMLSPRLLIADEATTALDSMSAHRVMELLAHKQAETGCAILFITHDWRHVRRYANRLSVMKEGKIVESGGKHRILDHPQHEYTRQLIEAAPVLSNELKSGLKEVGAE
ncbi:ABC transporter ATP-binding protein [Paenibacillus polysaccharolyticus]|uniref:ABC transporter ATP-binding protein n=1 Tax=Paenibacillus polysaccharolyticus TaxID=582692 RepID=UPI00203C19EA|nr:ABC transporter ATP-binding protein [Paenibacillus polysaccharolyticus]MCM3134365.1 ABC transporter ATP-binding protein [Paenibacillus polysaccharolyticus]